MFRKTSLLLHKTLFLELAFYVFYNNFTTFNVCNNTNSLNNNTIWFKNENVYILKKQALSIIGNNILNILVILIPLSQTVSKFNEFK